MKSPRFAGHAAGVTALTLRDELLASGAADNSTKLWNVARMPGAVGLGVPSKGEVFGGLWLLVINGD